METTAKTYVNTASKSVANTATGGKAMPAVPFLQQKPNEQLAPLQLMTIPSYPPLTKFVASPILPPTDNKHQQFVAPQKESKHLSSEALTRYIPIQKKANDIRLQHNPNSGAENLNWNMSNVLDTQRKTTQFQTQSLLTAPVIQLCKSPDEIIAGIGKSATSSSSSSSSSSTPAILPRQQLVAYKACNEEMFNKSLGRGNEETEAENAPDNAGEKWFAITALFEKANEAIDTLLAKNDKEITLDDLTKIRDAIDANNAAYEELKTGDIGEEAVGSSVEMDAATKEKTGRAKAAAAKQAKQDAEWKAALTSRRSTGGYVSWDYGNRTYHVNLTLGPFHVTDEASKFHYFFKETGEKIVNTPGNGATTDKPFSALPPNVQAFIKKNFYALLK